MVQTRSAVLVGASGLVGGHLLRLLVEDKTYDRVTVLVRKPPFFQHPKLQESVIDFDQLEKHKALLQGHDLFCCLGTTLRVAGSQEAFRKVDFTYAVQAASFASTNGIEQLLLISSIGASKNSRAFYLRVKGEVEEAVSRIPFKAVQIFRPSFLLGNRKESRSTETFAHTVMKHISTALVGRLRRYRAIEAKTAAKAMIAVAKQQSTGVTVFESERIERLGQEYVIPV